MMPHRQQQGFTLIELMAVVLLVGIAAAVVTVSVGSGGRGQELRTSARYLYGAMAAALEEAVITQQQLGLRFDIDAEDGNDAYRYTWLILDTEAREWKSIRNELLQSAVLPEHLEIRLQVEGQELIIGAQDKDSFFTLKQSSDSSKPALQPDLYFLSSGEMPEFSLTLREKQQDSAEYTITGNMLGQMKLIQPHEQKD